MYNVLSTLKNACINFVAPPFCSYCKVFIQTRTVFCDYCKSRIVPVASVTMPLTGNYSIKTFAICAYQDPIKKLILAKGWSDICASKNLGQLMWDMTNLKHMPIDYLIPIPLHWTRLAKRGFNQTVEIANEISRKSNMPIANILKRTKRTQFQATLSAGQRGKNVKDAFALQCNNTNASLYAGKHLVLVDDLMTTGSTLQAAARELVKLKPASITAVVACRVV